MLLKKTGDRMIIGIDLFVLLRDCKRLHSNLGGVKGRESLKHKASIVQTETENWMMGLSWGDVMRLLHSLTVRSMPKDAVSLRCARGAGPEPQDPGAGRFNGSA